jgi:hypothetical protein
MAETQRTFDPLHFNFLEVGADEPILHRLARGGALA